MDNDTILNWQVERACLNAWPGTRQVFADGWLLRASGGPTRRANSANPLSGDAEASEGFIDRAEAFYGGIGQPPIFRLPAMAAGIDGLLAARGYALEAPTRTLLADLAGFASSDAAIETAPSRSWLSARHRLSGSSPQAVHSDHAIIDTILLPRAFVAMREGRRIVSLGFAVRQDDLLILELVMTDPACRQRGFATQCVSALLGWGRAQGCRAAALQVVAENEAALALYARLGFTRDLYGYHYRTKR